MTPSKRLAGKQVAVEVFANRDTGAFGRSPLQMGWSRPDRVWLDGTRLRFERSGQREPVVPPADFLDQFLRLAGATPTDVERFAQRYGVVGLCEQHELPLSHRRDSIGDEPYPCDLLGGRKPFVPVDWLPSFARQCSSLLRLAANLQGSVAGIADDWRVFDPGYDGQEAVKFDLHWQRVELTTDDRVDAGRESVATVLDDWLAVADLRVRLAWDVESRPVFKLTVNTLFGAIVASLASAITRNDLAVCSSCGRAYTPTRRPAAGRRNYCDDARCKRARGAENQRKYRQRKGGE